MERRGRDRSAVAPLGLRDFRRLIPGARAPGYTPSALRACAETLLSNYGETRKYLGNEVVGTNTIGKAGLQYPRLQG